MKNIIVSDEFNVKAPGIAPAQDITEMEAESSTALPHEIVHEAETTHPGETVGSGGSTTGPLGPGPQAPELQGAPHSQQTIFYDMIIKQTGCKRLSKQAASGPLV